ncbi:MAG TPA: LPS export ABC transporter periplasmic protein LptC [Phenylobacterium sp.]|nr:LPS export ABC transporter periplasmic protein LptC [Phenylobacterium sp.]
MPFPTRRESILRWRRRSRAIRALRILLPALIGVILAALAGTVAYNTFTSQPGLATSSNAPIRLVNPRFVGRDDRGRPFVLIAVTATRDAQDYQKVYLDRPSLVLDKDGPDPLRITAAKGVYHEGTRKLEVSGGVRLAGARGAFDTAESLFDTKTGELIGPGAIHGSGPLGEIDAKSYGVYDKGARMVFKGGVHTVLNSK